MRKFKLLLTVGGALSIGLTGVARAASVADTAELLDQIGTLQERVQDLESKASERWLDERRAEEVKGLIHEVLSDADTRSSLLGSSLSSGWDDGFYLASEDGGFVLRIDGRVQFRGVYNTRNGNPTDNEEGGHEIRRANLNFSGQINSGPIVRYSVGVQTSRSDQMALLDHAWISRDLTEDLTLTLGEAKGSFLAEELVSANYQLAADRSLMNEAFTQGRTQGLWLAWDGPDNSTVTISVNDGSRSGEAGGSGLSGADDKDFDADNTDFAGTIRAELLVSGGWDQFMDFTADRDDPMGLKIGGALHYEAGETGSTADNDNFVAWTLDAAYENSGTSLFAAIAGHREDLDTTGAHEQDLLGLVVQGGYRLTDDFEAFARWEYIDLDGGNAGTLGDDELQLLTFGVNHHLKNHAAKFTLDLVWALNPIPAAADMNMTTDTLEGLALLPDDTGAENQTVVRAQFQLLF